jgi:uncharacterized protein
MLHNDDTNKYRPLALASGLFVTGLIAILAVRAGNNPSESELDWLNKLAAQGDAGAQLQLGLAYRDGRYGLHPDPRASLDWLRAAGEAGDSYAADAVANDYANGAGIPHDPQQAVYWWSRAARGGNADAQTHLGEYLLSEGHDDEAVDWLRDAANRGDMRARTDLSKLYRKDILPEQELPDADLLRGANPVAVLGEQLNSISLKALITILDAAETDSPLLQSSDELLQRAISGDPLAEYQLGLRYRNGAWAVGRDPVKARVWLERAAAAGNRNAAEALAELKEQSVSVQSPPGRPIQTNQTPNH